MEKCPNCEQDFTACILSRCNRQSKASACSPAGRGSLAAALNARRDEIIGQVFVPWGGYADRDFVFVRDDGNSYTVSMPMTPQQIIDEIAKGSLLHDWLTVIGVPKQYVRLIL